MSLISLTDKFFSLETPSISPIRSTVALGTSSCQFSSFKIRGRDSWYQSVDYVFGDLSISSRSDYLTAADSHHMLFGIDMSLGMQEC